MRDARHRGEYGYDAPYAVIVFAGIVREAIRVLRPGGGIAIADIRTTGLYADPLASLGAKNIQRRRLGWRFWWGNPIAASVLVTATKERL